MHAHARKTEKRKSRLLYSICQWAIPLTCGQTAVLFDNVVKRMGKKPKYMDYPKPQARETGCKVSWYYYASYEDAQKASLAAKHNAVIQEGLGYDFGYQSPGSIRKVTEARRNGMWEVVLP